MKNCLLYSFMECFHVPAWIPLRLILEICEIWLRSSSESNHIKPETQPQLISSSLDHTKRPVKPRRDHKQLQPARVDELSSRWKKDCKNNAQPATIAPPFHVRSIIFDINVKENIS